MTAYMADLMLTGRRGFRRGSARGEFAVQFVNRFDVDQVGAHP